MAFGRDRRTRIRRFLVCFSSKMCSDTEVISSDAEATLPSLSTRLAIHPYRRGIRRVPALATSFRRMSVCVYEVLDIGEPISNGAFPYFDPCQAGFTEMPPYSECVRRYTQHGCDLLRTQQRVL